MSNQKHLTLESRITIEKGLDNRLSFKSIARSIDKDCTTVSKEVRGHLSFEKTGCYYGKKNLMTSCPGRYLCLLPYPPEQLSIINASIR